MKKLIAIISFLVAAIIVTVLCIGCAGSNPKDRPTDASVSLGGSIKGAWGHTESADYDIKQSMTFLGGDVGKAFAQAALQEHSAVFRDLTCAGTALDQTNVQYQSAMARIRLLESDKAVLTSEIQAEREQWFGDRTHKLAGWILGLGSIAVLALTFFHFYLGGTLSTLLPFTALFKRGGT